MTLLTPSCAAVRVFVSELSGDISARPAQIAE
jgi:hypothetical protein